MTDIPLTPPSLPNMGGQPQPPAPAPVAPQAPTPQPEPSVQPQISSRFLQDLQSINPTPFRDPMAAGQPIQPQALASSGMVPEQSSQNTLPSVFSADAQSAAVPQETVGMNANSSAPTPPSGGKPALPVAAAAGILGGLSNTVKMGIGAAVLVLGLVAGGFWWWQGQSADTVTPSTGGKTATTTPAQKNVKLTYWGLWEPEEVMKPLIEEYQKQNPGVQITYVQQKSQQYRSRLQASIRDGSGPDMFRFHNTWLPMVKEDLAPAPKAVFPAKTLEDEFWPIVSKEYVINNEVYGVPLMYEGLALVYNQSMLEAANAQPPKDWEQLRQLATQLTIRQGNTLQRAGVALGLTSNVDNFSDILALMMLQNAAEPGNPTTQNAYHALEFYTIFSRVDQVWDETMPSSTQAFANEQVAMIIVPSWRIFEIQRQNPNIKIGVTRVPQLAGEPITWASYWVEGVSSGSKNKEEAWKFLAYLGQPEQMRKFHSAAASYRGFGELYPRIDLSKELANNELVKPYLDDALYAKSWSLASMTHDEGLNDQLIQYYTDAVNVMLKQSNAERAFRQILPGIQQVFSKYGVTVSGLPTPTPTPRPSSL